MLFALISVARADGTEAQTYGPHEFRVVRHGMSPGRRFSIAAHGDGESGSDHFALYLMSEPRHKKDSGVA